MFKSGTVIQTVVTDEINRVNIVVGIHKNAFYEMMMNLVSSSTFMTLEHWYTYMESYISYLTVPVTYVSSLEEFKDINEKYVDACIERLLSMPFTSSFVVIDKRNIVKLREVENFDNYMLKSCLVDEVLSTSMSKILLKCKDIKDLIQDEYEKVKIIKATHLYQKQGALKTNHLYLVKMDKENMRLIYVMGKLSETEYLYCLVYDGMLHFTELKTIETFLFRYFTRNYKNKILTVLQGQDREVKFLNTENKRILCTNLESVPMCVDSKIINSYEHSSLYQKYKENLIESILFA